MVFNKQSLNWFSLSPDHQQRISSFLGSEQYRAPIANINNYWISRKAQMRLALVKEGIEFAGDSNLNSRQGDGGDGLKSILNDLQLGFLEGLRGLLTFLTEYPLKARGRLDRIMERERGKRVRALLVDPQSKYFPFKSWEAASIKDPILSQLGWAWPLRTLHMLRALDVIRHFAPHLSGGGARVIEIGSGPAILCGIMARLLKTQHVLVDLPEQMVVGFSLLSEFFPDKKVVLPHEIGAGDALPEDADVVYLTPGQTRKIRLNTFDAGVNMFSFQEMSYETIRDYFRLFRECLKKENIFYCVNRVSKPNPFDQTVTEFAKFPWQDGDGFLHDTVIPDNKIGGVRLFGAPVRESLVRLKTNVN